MKATRVVLVVAAVAAVAAVAKKYLTPGVYVEEVPSSPRPIGAVGTSTAARVRERLKRAREAYSQEMASGSRPIEAVGTAIAAFVGLAPEPPPPPPPPPR